MGDISVRSKSGLLVNIKLEFFTFPGGEVGCKVHSFQYNGIVPLEIVAHLRSSEDIMNLLMATDALRRLWPSSELHLFCPYLPYARQDRVSNPGESLSLKVMCDLINAQKYDSVTVWDVHSDVALALLDGVRNIHQSAYIKKIPVGKNTVIVSPDAGATKKAFITAQMLGLDMIECSKHRDTKTGEITGTSINYGRFRGPEIEYLIVDDICDGGRTFIEIAKKLRAGCLTSRPKISLYVTHGIFSKGLNPLIDAGIGHVYCANPWVTSDKTNLPHYTHIK